MAKKDKSVMSTGMEKAVETLKKEAGVAIELQATNLLANIEGYRRAKDAIAKINATLDQRIADLADLEATSTG